MFIFSVYFPIHGAAQAPAVGPRLLGQRPGEFAGAVQWHRPKLPDIFWQVFWQGCWPG
jgi:hypothetical protein